MHNDIFVKNYAIKKLIKNFDIIDIVSKFLKLEKKSSGFWCICPFHEEKTPSFYINKTSQRYYCFGCNKNGDVINFVMTYKKYNFTSAFNFIINTNTNTNINTEIKYTEEKSLHKINNIFDILNKFVLECLDYENDIHYFLSKRKINFNSIKLFKICFISKKVLVTLNKTILNRNIIKKLTEIGLLYEKNKKLYSKFNNRILFPIRNVKGDYIAIGGRALNEFIKPKYINSNESRIFSKKKELYGLHECINFKKKFDYIIIVEGYIDVITLNQNGIQNVIAILGTALSYEHLILLKSFYKKLIFCMDGDIPGKLSALRSAYLCLPLLLEFESISFAIIPQKIDPDTFVNKYGKKEFLIILDNAIFILDFILISLNTTFKIRKNIFKLMYKINIIISKIKNALVKSLIIHYLTKFFMLKKHYLNCYYELTFAIKAFFILLKNKYLIEKINLKTIISNINISFKSHVNMFFELIFLLKNNTKLNFIEINKRLIKKLKIKNIHSLFFIRSLNNIYVVFEFKNILKKIQDLKNVEQSLCMI